MRYICALELRKVHLKTENMSLFLQLFTLPAGY